MEQRKRRKILSHGKKNTCIDRISALPDFILCHILSSLPTKSSVAASILSRRWTSLWTDVPNLDFDDSNYNSSDVVCFPDMVSRVMFLHRAQNITSFRLALMDGHRSEYEVVSWIIAIIARNVRKMVLRIDKVKLPRCLFTCKTLVHLDLCIYGGIPKVGMVCFPRLKKLHLHRVRFEDDEFLTLPELLSGCPVLEELYIANRRNLHCRHISSTTIEILNIGYQIDCSSVTPTDKCRVDIDAPTLRHLRLANCLSLQVSAQTHNSLREADIHLQTSYIKPDYSYTVSLWNFVFNVCQVNRLTLSVACHLEKEFVDKAFTISRLGSSTMRFGNLTKLKLVGCPIFLTKLLELADNLEVLVFDQCCHGQVDDKDAKYWRELERVPRCLSLHIKTIKLHGLVDRDQHRESEFQMVQYFLRNAKVLEKMEIHSQCYGSDGHRSDWKEKFDVVQNILRFPRGSDACEVEFLCGVDASYK